MSKTKILAFLQNMWVKNPERVRMSIERSNDPDAWNWWCKTLLFEGCVTGKRLISIYPAKYLKQMVFTECTKEIASNPRDIMKPDNFHIEAELNKFRPDVVICFGRIAQNAVWKVIDNGGCEFVPAIIFSPHPAARGKYNEIKLNAAYQQLKSFLDNGKNKNTLS